jgi:DNA end-binding protein Ku
MGEMVGIGKLAIYGREYLVAVRAPVTKEYVGLLLHTLHHDAEIRPMDVVAIDMPPVAGVPRDQVRLAKELIAAGTQPLNLTDFTDEYRADLQRLITAKIAGEEIVVPPAIESAPVLNLRAALEQSLAATKKPQRKRA